MPTLKKCQRAGCYHTKTAHSRTSTGMCTVPYCACTKFLTEPREKR